MWLGTGIGRSVVSVGLCVSLWGNVRVLGELVGVRGAVLLMGGLVLVMGVLVRLGCAGVWLLG